MTSIYSSQSSAKSLDEPSPVIVNLNWFFMQYFTFHLTDRCFHKSVRHKYQQKVAAFIADYKPPLKKWFTKFRVLTYDYIMVQTYIVGNFVHDITTTWLVDPCCIMLRPQMIVICSDIGGLFIVIPFIASSFKLNLITNSHSMPIIIVFHLY